MQEAILNSANILTMYLVDLSGAPKTGLVTGDLTVYRCFLGAASANIPTGGLTLREVSSANQPGWYELSISSAYWGTLGRATMTISATATASWVETLNVVSVRADTGLRKLLGLSKHNSKLTVLTTNTLGHMLTGTLQVYDDNALTSLITTYNVAATYSAVTHGLQLHTVTEV